MRHVGLSRLAPRQQFEFDRVARRAAAEGSSSNSDREPSRHQRVVRERLQESNGQLDQNSRSPKSLRGSSNLEREPHHLQAVRAEPRPESDSRCSIRLSTAIAIVRDGDAQALPDQVDEIPAEKCNRRRSRSARATQIQFPVWVGRAARWCGTETQRGSHGRVASAARIAPSALSCARDDATASRIAVVARGAGWPCASRCASTFSGGAPAVCSPIATTRGSCAPPAKSWLLAVGWRRYGLIGLSEVPGT
jgi:hypothetical protein